MEFQFCFCKFDFQYKPKATNMLSLLLSLVGIMKIMKINQYQIQWKCMHVKCGLMVWNTSRHVVPFIWNKMLKFRTFKTIYNHDA